MKAAGIPIGRSLMHIYVESTDCLIGGGVSLDICGDLTYVSVELTPKQAREVSQAIDAAQLRAVAGVID